MSLYLLIFNLEFFSPKCCIFLQEELDYEEDELKKSSELEFPSPNESSSLDIPADVSVDSNNSALNVTVIAADDPLPQRTSPRNSQKVFFFLNNVDSIFYVF